MNGIILPITRSLFFLVIALWAIPASAQTLVGRLFDIYKAAAKDGKVVYYSEGREEENAKLGAFWKQNFPDVRLLITSKQTLELIPTIEAERAAGRVRADVVTITEPSVTAGWKAKGYYLPYRVKEFDKLAPRYADPDGAFYVPGVYLLTAAYNNRVYPDASALPKRFADFLAPQWKGKLVLAHPATAGSDFTYFVGMLQLGRIDWDGIQRLAAQDVLFVRGNAEAVGLLAAGERVLSPMVSSQNVLNARAKDQPVGFYALDEGSIQIERRSGIFKGGPNPAAAKLLLEVLTSPEGQSLVAEAGAYWPTHPDAVPPGHLPRLAELKPIAIDVDNDQGKSAEFLKHFDTVFGRE
jgi:iron(III) transport system substrate-binding protein